jgi:hypothetical protein
LQALQFDPHVDAEFRIEVGKRLIQQQDGRFDRERARERDALLLAAGQLRGAAVGEVREADALERRRDLAVDLGAGKVAAFQAERERNLKSREGIF